MDMPYVLIKSGMFYAYNSRGYVHDVRLAELYTEQRAKAEERSCSGEVVARPVTDFIDDVDRINDVIDRLEAMRDAVIATHPTDSGGDA